MKNLFAVPAGLTTGHEYFDRLASSDSIVIERIISRGERTPDGEWYDQDRDEWVALLQGEALLLFEHGEQVTMVSGDTLLIPAHYKHRVERTTASPPCIWLGVHGKLIEERQAEDSAGVSFSA